MARYVILAAFVSVAFSYPDAPLYPNNVVFASAPLLQQPVQPSPQFVSRTINNGAYTLQNAAAPNPTFLVSQPNQRNQPAQQSQRLTSPAPFQIVPEGAQPQSVPRNFVSFTRTPSLQFVQSPAEPQQSVPSNFVSFTRPAQQVVQAPAEPVQSVPHNFVTITRTMPQQFVQIPAEQQGLGARTVGSPAQNEQPQFAARRTPVQQQYGLRNVFPANEQAAQNAAPPQRSGVRTVIVFSPQQENLQIQNNQPDQRGKSVTPLKPPTVLLARPPQAPAAEQPQPSGNIQNQPFVASSQFFTRNFGDSGAVTYFIQPLSATAGQAANQASPDAEA